VILPAELLAFAAGCRKADIKPPPAAVYPVHKKHGRHIARYVLYMIIKEMRGK